MPTIWFCDYEGGTNANASVGNGDSFATRRKTIDNCVAAAIAPGDTIRIMGSPDATSLGQTATWTNGPLAANKGSLNSTNTTPINIGCTAHGYVAGDTVTVVGHTVNTNANGVWKVSNPTTNAFDLVNADGTNSVGNGAGSGGNIRKFTNAVVTLTTAVTQNIAECGNQGVKPNWTASANVTCAKSTADFKEGGESQSIAIAAGFTTGLAAYVATGTLNLSGYQQVSFWVKQTVGTIGAAGAVRLRLCTDTAGATPVHDCPIPALGALNQWVPVVVNLGTNLNAAIQSISFDVVTDNGAQTFLIDNVIACKAASSADSLNLTSLISKNTGDEAWFGIQSINGTRVVLDGIVNSIPGASPQRGYSGTTETVTTYKRETIKTVASASATNDVQLVQDAGTSGSLIAFSGGWNRTDMSTQTGTTWFDGQNGFGLAVRSNQVFVSLDKLNFTRYNRVDVTANDNTIGQIEISNFNSTPLNCTGSRLTATKLSAVCCGGPITPGAGAIVTTIARADSTTAGNGVTLGVGSWTGTIVQANNCTGSGVTSGTASYVGTISAANGNVGNGLNPGMYSTTGYLAASSNGYALGAGIQYTVLGGVSASNTQSGIQCQTNKSTVRNFTINEATEVTGFTPYNDGRIYSEKHDGTANNTQIFCDGGQISTDATVTHGSAAYSWKFAPTSTNRSQYYPLNLPIAQIACGASALVTVTAWMARSNTGLTGKLVCKGGQLAGVSSDVSSSTSAVAAAVTGATNASPIVISDNNGHALTTGDKIVITGAGGNTAANGSWTVTVIDWASFSLDGSTGNGTYTSGGRYGKWEQLTITFTPSEAGVVEIEAQFWGGTTYNGWVSDATFSQA